jgi:hypothetical protein
MLLDLDNFKNIHIGQDIYIIASGPSLDFINPSFFDNKITIGINQVYKKVRPTYLLRKEAQLIESITQEIPNIIHFISNGSSGSQKNDNKTTCETLLTQNENLKICCFEHNKNIHTLPDILPEKGIVVSYSTITSAIHLAAYMGAKNILLIGHDCGSLDNKINFNGYHTPETLSIVWPNEKEYLKWVSRDIEKDTIKLKKLLKEKYNTEVYSINPFINFGLEGHIYKKT